MADIFDTIDLGGDVGGDIFDTIDLGPAPEPVRPPARGLPSTGNILADVALDVGTGVFEGVGAAAIPAVSFLPALSSGVGELVTEFAATGGVSEEGLANAGRRTAQIMELASFEPVTQTGQEVLGAVSFPFEIYNELVNPIVRGTLLKAGFEGTEDDVQNASQFISDSLLLGITGGAGAAVRGARRGVRQAREARRPAPPAPVPTETLGPEIARTVGELRFREEGQPLVEPQAPRVPERLARDVFDEIAPEPTTRGPETLLREPEPAVAPEIVGRREVEGRIEPEIAEKASQERIQPADTIETVEAVDPLRLLEEPGEVPAGGLAADAPLPKIAGGDLSINLNRVGVDLPAKKLINDVAGERRATIQEARRGEITHDTTRELADKLGMTVNDLMNRRKGQAFNAEEALAARDILATSAQKVVDLRREAATNPTPENLATFRLGLEQHSLIQAEVSGATAEAGRALSSFNIKSAEQARVAKDFSKMLEELGGDEVNREILSRLGKLDHSELSTNKFVREAVKATTKDKVFEIWVNSLLSGPATHAVNILSNTLTFLSGIPESTAGAAFDFVQSRVTGKPQERFFGEAPWKFVGAWPGMKEGVRKGIQAFLTETPTEGISKLERQGKRSIEGPAGRVVRTPGNLLLAMDEFFKSVNFTSENHGLAYRKATQEGLKGDARMRRMQELIDRPTPDMEAAATKEMLHRVFQSELSPAVKKVASLRNHWGINYIIPFIRTPVNILKFGLERTPLNYANIFRKVMKGELAGGELSSQLGITTMGSMIGATTFMHALEGNISGRGPDNRNERAALFRTGWQPYSVKVGDKWISYSRLEPLGMVLGLAADASEIWGEMDEEEREDVATLIVKSITQNLTSKTWLRGVGDLLNAMTDPVRYGETWIQRFAGTLIPTGVAAGARALDPTIRRVENIFDKVKSRTPGLSRTVLPRLNLWGEPITYEGGPIAQLISPIFISSDTESPADDEMVRLKVAVGMPGKSIAGIKLTPEQHNEYIRTAGQLAKQRLDEVLNSTAYKNMSDDRKASLIKTIIRQTRKAAANQIRPTLNTGGTP
jgi:hypothetical protein